MVCEELYQNTLKELSLYLKKIKETKKNRMKLIRLYHFPFGILFRPRLNGIVEGYLTSEDTAGALSNQLDSLLTHCRGASNISVTYYTTEVPYQAGTTHNLVELMRLFRDFGSKTTGNGKEIPIEVFSVVVFMCEFKDGSTFLCHTQVHSLW